MNFDYHNEQDLFMVVFLRKDAYALSYEYIVNIPGMRARNDFKYFYSCILLPYLIKILKYIL